MQNKIFCHICEEELAETIDNLPDKCPICDTRKYEIIQEIQSLGEDKNDLDWTEVSNNELADISESTSQIVPTVVEEQETRDIINNDEHHEDVVIFRENISSADQQIENVAKNGDNISNLNITNAQVIEEDESVTEEVSNSSDDVIFEEVKKDSDDVIFEEVKKDSDDVIFEEIKKDSDDVIFEEVQSNTSTTTKQEPKMQKTGASALEILPQKGVGFSPGYYLVLYNIERKALAYFRLDNAGSIIIGRSSERGSPNDIDITMAWKQYYQKVSENKGEFQDKMRMVKGISRKHALIRFDKEKKCYVFFHLSDKNYTIINTPQREKRERAPGNRNPIYLEPNSMISMGNNKNYIIMRFKAI